MLQVKLVQQMQRHSQNAADQRTVVRQDWGPVSSIGTTHVVLTAQQLADCLARGPSVKSNAFQMWYVCEVQVRPASGKKWLGAGGLEADCPVVVV